MIEFSKNIIRSFIDLPNNLSLIIHSIGCNLNCFHCFNFESMVANPVDVCGSEYILEEIKRDGFLSTAIIFSGGEFLLNRIDDLMIFLTDVRKIYRGIIIVNTNGTFPKKMMALVESDLVDGFHTDMKLPYNLINNDSAEFIKLATGIEKINIEDILKSLEYTVMYDKGYSQIRSVMYPFLDSNVFDNNQEYVNILNVKYQKNTHYYKNEFIDAS